MRAYNNILVVHLRGGLGDVLLSSAVFAALKQGYPDARLTALVSPQAAPVLYGHPAIHHHLNFNPLELNHPLALLRRAKWLKSFNFDLGIILWSKAQEAWLLRLAGIKDLVGQDSRLLYSWLYRYKVKVRSEAGDTGSHWSQCLLDYVRALGLDVETPEISFNLPPEAESYAASLLPQALKPPVIGLHIGKGLAISSANWPLAHWARLGDALAQDLGASLILTGSEVEKSAVDATQALMLSKVFNLAGKTTFAQLAAVIKRCQLFICPDSAPMHLAAALKVPTAGIFALKSDYPSRWGPYGTNSAIIRPSRWKCADNCVKERCGYFSCYEEISPGELVSAARALLQI